MTRCYLRFAGYMLPALIVCTSLALLGAQAKPSDADPYAPTKQEWLCVSFNSSYRAEYYDPDVVFTSAATDPNPNQVILQSWLSEQADRARFNKLTQAKRQALEARARLLGFGDWLVIKEEIRLID